MFGIRLEIVKLQTIFVLHVTVNTITFVDHFIFISRCFVLGNQQQLNL